MTPQQSAALWSSPTGSLTQVFARLVHCIFIAAEETAATGDDLKPQLAALYDEQVGRCVEDMRGLQKLSFSRLPFWIPWEGRRSWAVHR